MAGIGGQDISRATGWTEVAHASVTLVPFGFYFLVVEVISVSDRMFGECDLSP